MVNKQLQYSYCPIAQDISLLFVKYFVIISLFSFKPMMQSRKGKFPSDAFP